MGMLGGSFFPAAAGMGGQVGMFLNTVQLCLLEVVIQWLCPSWFGSHQL